MQNCTSEKCYSWQQGGEVLSLHRHQVYWSPLIALPSMQITNGVRCMFRSPVTWKLLLANTVFTIVLAIVVVDFNDLINPEWSLFQDTDLPTQTEIYGAKAALLAMAAATTLFVGLIPAGSNGGRTVNVWVGLVGGLAAGATGWFWLLNATEGEPRPYLVAIVPSIAIYMTAVVLGVVMRYANIKDTRQIRETGRATLTLGSIVLGLVTIFAFALIFGLIFLLPRWII